MSLIIMESVFLNFVEVWILEYLMVELVVIYQEELCFMVEME